VFALVVLAATLVGFAAVEPLGVSPAWVAAAGALVLLVRRGVTGGRGERPDRERPSRLVVRAVNAPFLVFVLALGIVVLAVSSGPVGDAIARLVPDHADLLGLLAAATLAAVLANLLNNLPATLLLVPLVAHSPGLLLAVLLGVNIGPNLTYVGSLATLLWRQVLHSHDHAPSAGRFVRLGLATVPACLVVGVAALWWGLDVWGA
jgi:arsenical pump membrane protein